MNGKSCKGCIKGIPISLTNDILCREKGVVSSEYVCSHHKSPPSIKTPRELNFKCVDCDNFCQLVALSVNNLTIGTCSLFANRPFDGNKRGACKRFVLRKIKDVI